MNQNAKKGLLVTGPSQEVSAAGGATTPSLPHTEPAAQQAGLFPVTSTTPIARPLVLVTRGRVEYLAHCPKCSDWHRHVHLGDVTGPCGTKYDLQPRAKLKGAA